MVARVLDQAPSGGHPCEAVNSRSRGKSSLAERHVFRLVLLFSSFILFRLNINHSLYRVQTPKLSAAFCSEVSRFSLLPLPSPEYPSFNSLARAYQGIRKRRIAAQPKLLLQ